MQKKTVLSGIRPTGKLHLGNYFGALENFVKIQNDYECYFFVADWHALTTGYNETDNIVENVNEMIYDWLSVGLNPDNCAIFLQSSIKQHAELHLLFSMVTPLSWLMRCPTYKDMMTQLKDKDLATYGFLGYPCLQAADILIYNADFVPVGEDQLPHLELTREIARRFNFIYGDVFKEPQPLLTKAKVLLGTDGRKMSKSYNNTIMISENPDEVKKKVMSMVTDPSRIRKDDPGHPDICSVFLFHKIFSPDELPEIESDCKAGKIGCVQCKRNLAEKLCSYMSPIYQKRCDLAKNKDLPKEILLEGYKKALPKTEETMQSVREAMKLMDLTRS